MHDVDIKEKWDLIMSRLEDYYAIYNLYNLKPI